MSTEPIEHQQPTPGPMWRDGPAYAVIAAELEQVLSVTGTVGLALKGLQTDGEEDIRRTLYGSIADPLYVLIDRLRSDDPSESEKDRYAALGKKLVEVVRE